MPESEHTPNYNPSARKGFSYLNCSCLGLRIFGTTAQLETAWSQHISEVQSGQTTGTSLRTQAFTELHRSISQQARTAIIEVHLERNPIKLEQLTRRERTILNLAFAVAATGALHNQARKAGVARDWEMHPTTVQLAIRGIGPLLKRNAEARLRLHLAITRLETQLADHNFTFELPPEWQTYLEDG